MTDTEPFALLVTAGALAGLAAILSNRLSARIQVPAPALFLAAAAIAAAAVPALEAPPHRTVERVVTIALVVILFDGGMHIGRRQARSAWKEITVIGIAGTLLTTVGAAVLVHLAFGIDWYAATLIGTAVAPTDPAVVFSVLGNREIKGRSGTILQGESGANDPVGIALMASLVSAGGLSGHAWGEVAGTFVLQLVVGAAIGAVGGLLLLAAMRRLLPGAGLYPLRALAGAMLLYGVAALAHGSGFLAVFVAGILIGEEPAPHKREVRTFHASLASLSEIIAFVFLGLTVHLDVIAHADVWVPALVLVVVLALVIRPLAVGPLLWRSALPANERRFVLFCGLKGAVPILLGTLLLGAGIADAQRFYSIVVVVVAFSVVVQGGLVPLVARRLGVPMHIIQPETWPAPAEQHSD